jgi:FkbM family methyltransferase
MSFLHRLESGLGQFRRAVDNLGVSGAVLLKCQQYRVRTLGAAAPYVLRSKHARFPLWCRPGTSDARVFHQIFVVREYSCLDELRDPRLIIDCGANVGYSSAYFLSRFPAARVIAVEPDAGNVDLLERNLRPFGNRATIVRSAVWSHPAELVIDATAGDGAEWSRQVRPCRPGETPDLRATDIGTLLAQSGEQTISLLKLDIEGAEVALFAAGHEAWLPRTSNIVIELHGEACARAFFAAVSRESFRIYNHEELTVCHRLDLRDPSKDVV